MLLSLLSSLLFRFSHLKLSINLRSSNSSIPLPTNIRITLSQVCRCVTPKRRKVGCFCLCPVGAPTRKIPTPAGLYSPVFLFFCGKTAPLLLRAPRGAIFHHHCLCAPGCVVQGYCRKHQVPRSVNVFVCFAGAGTNT